jgi:hypothetical protein
MGRAIVIAAILALGLAACGTAAAGSSSHSTAPGHHASPAAHVRTYPEQAADKALCSTYNSDIANGDTYDLGQALQQAQGTVSPKLADDIAVVVNESGTVQQDLINQVHVAEDCAVASVGVPPH